MKGKRNDMKLWWGLWWIAVVAFFACAVCMLPGCGEKPEEDSRFTMTLIERTVDGIYYTLTDHETGNTYLYLRNGGEASLALIPEKDPVAQATLSSTCGGIHLVEDNTFTGETEPMIFGQAAQVLPMEPVMEEIEREPELESLGVFTVTAYCACHECCGKTPDDPRYGITATGTRATQGRTIAVDPSVISYGTTVYFEGIDGFGGYVAEDCGGAIKGKDIDLYFESHAETDIWGVRELEVFAYSE